MKFYFGILRETIRFKIYKFIKLFPLKKWVNATFLSSLLGVQYYTGQFFDLKAITEAGHKKVSQVLINFIWVSAKKKHQKQQQQQQYFIYTWIYINIYNNIFKFPMYKWRPPVVTIESSLKQVAFTEEELQRLMVRITSKVM